MSSINFNAPWDPLQHVWMGASYGPEFYEPIRDHQVRDSLQRISTETEEDYQNLKKVLESFGIRVDRPVIDSSTTIMDYVNNQGHVDYHTSKSFTLIPRPPMQPRDSVLVIGDIMIGTNQEFDWFEPLVNGLLEANPRIPYDINKIFDGALITVIGKHVIVDCRDHPWLPNYIQNLFPDRSVISVTIGGHNDAVFCPVRPGLIVSTYHHDHYAETFPDWKIKFIDNQSWNAIPDWRKYKHNNVDKWWVPDNINNAEFNQFVNTWLNNWLGYVKETVFDVNMLQLDPHTILVNNYNKEMFEFFKLHRIEPIVVPFRHRFFWDGGIHCVTADIQRQGEAHDYISR